MKPIEFLTETDQYNAPFGATMEARVHKDIKIFSSPTQEWEVLSYYLGKDGHMVLDIGKKMDTNPHPVVTLWHD